jgi:hypothetical protein
MHLFKTISWDSTVGIATGYVLDDRGVGFRVPVGSRIFCSPRHSDQLWGPPSFLSNGYCELFRRGQSSRGVKLITHLQHLNACPPSFIAWENVLSVILKTCSNNTPKGGRTPTASKQASRHETKETKTDVSIMTQIGMRRFS